MENFGPCGTISKKIAIFVRNPKPIAYDLNPLTFL